MRNQYSVLSCLHNESYFRANIVIDIEENPKIVTNDDHYNFINHNMNNNIISLAMCVNNKITKNIY